MVFWPSAVLMFITECPLLPEWTDQPIGRSIPVGLSSELSGVTNAQLLLLDAEGERLASCVLPGASFDLGALMPEVWALEKAAWLQVFVEAEPVGAPLVAIPLLSRQVPIMEPASTPEGRAYARVVGWRDELDVPVEPPVFPDRPPADAEPSVQRAWGELVERMQAEYERQLEEAAAIRELLPLRTGLRLIPDRLVVIRTDYGEINVQMRWDAAPHTAEHFSKLAQNGYYRDVIFHRIVPYTGNGDPFVIQAGDPSGTGNGGPGTWLPMERSPLPHDFGVISMARDNDPDSAGSQFFLCLSREGTARLDGSYTSFGETLSGAGAIRSIASVELADPETGSPVRPPRILGMRLVPAPSRMVRQAPETIDPVASPANRFPR